MRPSPGQVVGGKYRIVRLIGDGGMGAVFEARHEVLGSAVALKFLHDELARRTGLAARFLQEARVSASIQSPHVTRVIDVEQTPSGAPYLVMELLVGESLQQLLDQKLKLPRDQAVDFGLQILSGLEAAHALGVVHRDLKPDNVFVTATSGGPVLKLLDFGIAKLRQAHEYQRGLTRPGVVMGTPEYMAPEQLYGADRVDHRADIYSLGAMLYEILTGERPAYGDDATEIIAQVAQGKVKPLLDHEPELPPGLAAVVHRALDPDPNRRFDNATEMRLALARFAGQLSHAGRLAATPAPVGVTPVVVAPSAAPPAPAVVRGAVAATPKAPPSADDRAPPGSRLPAPPASAVPGGVAPAFRGVPPTLPPEDELVAAGAGGAKGSTQDVPREEIQRRIATAAVALPPPTPVVGSLVGSLGRPPARRPRRRLAHALGALLLGVAVTLAVVVAVVALRRNDDGDEPQLPSLSPPPAVTLSAHGNDASVPLQPPGAPPATAPPPTRPSPGSRPGGTTTDAGTDAGPTGFPFPLPSTFPTLPSSFPPLPSSFPPVPSSLPPFTLPFPPP